jgi:hypothetical protein
MLKEYEVQLQQLRTFSQRVLNFAEGAETTARLSDGLPFRSSRRRSFSDSAPTSSNLANEISTKIQPPPVVIQNAGDHQSSIEIDDTLSIQSHFQTTEDNLPISRNHPRKGETRVPSRLVSKKAIIDLGYPFEEEVWNSILHVFQTPTPSGRIERRVQFI